VITVAALVAAGMLLQSPGLFVVAAVMTIPSSIAAVPTYYVLYGITALIPGANPSSGSGKGVSTPGGGTVSVVTGEPALWFTVSMGVLAVVVMALAAYANALALKAIRERAGHRHRPELPA
jgi:hypothetical protein